MNNIPSEVTAAIAALPETPAAPLKGRGFAREIVKADHLIFASLLPDSHKAEVQYRGKSGYEAPQWVLAISPEAHAAILPLIEAAQQESRDSFRAMVNGVHVSFSAMPKWTSGPIFLRSLTPEGEWESVDLDRQKKRVGGYAAATLGSIFHAAGGTWSGEYNAPIEGEALAIVVENNEGQLVLEVLPVGGFHADSIDDIAALYLAGFRPRRLITSDVGQFLATEPAAKIEGENPHEFLLSFPAGTSFADHDCDDASNFPHRIDNGIGDGGFVLWEAHDGSLFAKYHGVSEEGSHHHVEFMLSLSAESWDGHSIVRRLSPEQSAAAAETKLAAIRQAEADREAEFKAEQERLAAKAAATAARVEDELIEVGTVEILRETDKAIQIRHATAGELWMPKSQSRLADGVLRASRWILSQKGILNLFIL